MVKLSKYDEIDRNDVLFLYYLVLFIQILYL